MCIRDSSNSGTSPAVETRTISTATMAPTRTVGHTRRDEGLIIEAGSPRVIRPVPPDEATRVGKGEATDRVDDRGR